MASCKTVSFDPNPSLATRAIASNSKATVLFWWASQCPCVMRYKTRIEELKERYSSQGVQFIAVSSNSDDDNKTQTLETATHRGFTLPLQMDNHGALAQSLGVKTTPTVVLLNQAGDVKYRGWIDNERFPGEPGRKAYLEDALKELLQDAEVSETTSPIYGCRITKRLR